MASKVDDLAEREEFRLHKCAYENDMKEITIQLNKREQQFHIDAGDPRGNTPLHIATMLGHRGIVEILLNHNASLDVVNTKYQKPLNEAISFGNGAIITSLLNKLQEQSMENALAKRELLTDFLNISGDFSLNFVWRFRNNMIKLLYGFLEPELYSLTKKGKCMRMNLTMIDPNEHLPLNASLLYNGDDPNLNRALCLLDHDCKEYQWIYHKSTHSVETDVDFLMKSSNIATKLKIKPQKKLRRRATGKVDRYNTVFHTMKTLTTIETVRNEHLPKKRKHKDTTSRMDTIAEDSVEANPTCGSENEPRKEAHTRHNSGSSSSDCEMSSESGRESSGISDSDTAMEESSTELTTTPKKRLSPNAISQFMSGIYKKIRGSPSRDTSQAQMEPEISWTKYVNSKKKEIGRKMEMMTRDQDEHVQLELTADFELKKAELEMILSCFNVLAHFKKLQYVINLNEDELVPVFVETDVSVLHTGRVRLEKFQWRDDITDTAQFEIPAEYTENQSRIQGLGF